MCVEEWLNTRWQKYSQAGSMFWKFRKPLVQRFVLPSPFRWPWVKYSHFHTLVIRGMPCHTGNHGEQSFRAWEMLIFCSNRAQTRTSERTQAQSVARTLLKFCAVTCIPLQVCYLTPRPGGPPPSHVSNQLSQCAGVSSCFASFGPAIALITSVL